MSKFYTQARVVSIASATQGNPHMTEIDWDELIRIITELIPVIISCFRPVSGSQMRNYAAQHWREEDAGNLYGGYRVALVKNVTNRAMRAAERLRIPFTWDQAYEVARRTLDEARVTADVEQLAAVIAEHGA